MLSQESVIPGALLTYMEGLKTHDIGLIRCTFTEHIQFVTPAKTMRKRQILGFLATF